MYAKLRAIYIETKLQTTQHYLILSFLKDTKRSVTSLPALFSAQFLKKSISLDTL